MQGRNIEFVLFDLKNADDLDQVNRRLAALRISPLFADRREKGLLALSDPSGVVQELDLAEGPEKLEQKIAAYLAGN